MKTLVVYYARSYITELLAREIAMSLGADVEVLIDAKKRLEPRPIRHLIEDIDARRRKLTSIHVQKSPLDYDLIVIGTPLLFGGITPEVRAYLASQNLDGKKVGFFLTDSGGGTEKVV
jgi:menaquinone-dependent protoporphyrinogen IX oxidase